MKTVDRVNIGVVTGYISDEGTKTEIHHEPVNESNPSLMLGRVLLGLLAVAIAFVLLAAPSWLERLAAMP